MEEILSWRKLSNVKTHYLYFWANVTRMIRERTTRWEGMWHVRGRRNLVGKPAGKGRPTTLLLTRCL